MVLHRRDAGRRMARFYRLALQPALPLGEDAGRCDLVREWGRIGQGGRVRADPFASAALAEQAAAVMEAVKRRRGYR